MSLFGTITDALGITDPLDIPDAVDASPGVFDQATNSTVAPDSPDLMGPSQASDMTIAGDNPDSSGLAAGGFDSSSSSGSNLLGNVAKAAAGTFGGAAGGAGLMHNPYGNARVPSIHEVQMNRTNAPGKPVERSHAAPVASADQIEMHWIQRMRLFSGIYSQGRPTV